MLLRAFLPWILGGFPMIFSPLIHSCISHRQFWKSLIVPVPVSTQQGLEKEKASGDLDPKHLILVPYPQDNSTQNLKILGQDATRFGSLEFLCSLLTALLPRLFQPPSGTTELWKLGTQEDQQRADFLHGFPSSLGNNFKMAASCCHCYIIDRETIAPSKGGTQRLTKMMTCSICKSSTYNQHNYMQRRMQLCNHQSRRNERKPTVITPIAEITLAWTCSG